MSSKIIRANIYYVLDGKTPVPAAGIEAWSEWFHGSDRHVDETILGPLRVSTVFMGVNVSPSSEPPKLFETVVFDTRKGPYDEVYCEQCATWSEAQ
jgi:hypothetical protein